MLGVTIACLVKELSIVSVNLFTNNSVGVAENLQLFWGNVANDADSKAGTWEWLPVDKVLWQTKRDAQCTNLILEEVVQRLNQVKMNALWEWNQVVVALDGCSLAAGLASTRLNNVRVDGALCQELNAVQLLGLVKEDLPELGANQTTLHLWLGNASQ